MMWWMKCQIVTLNEVSMAACGPRGRRRATAFPCKSVQICRQFPIISVNDVRHMEVKRKTRYLKLVPLLSAWQAPFSTIYRRQLFIAVNQIVTNVSTGLCTWRFFCDKCNDKCQSLDRFLHSLSDFPAFSRIRLSRGTSSWAKFTFFSHTSSNFWFTDDEIAVNSTISTFVSHKTRQDNFNSK